MHWEQRLRILASRQAGVIGIDQMELAGCTADHWWRARRNGRWTTWTRRVQVLDGAPASDDQRVHAALLDAGGGAVLHGRSTLAWFGLRGFDLSTIHAARRWGTTNAPSALAAVHRLRDIRPQDLVVARGIPTVTPLRAIWSEASRYSSGRLYEQGLSRIGRLLDDAHRKGLVTWTALHQSIGDLQRRGRAGTRLMRELGVKRTPGSSPTESRNEDQLEKILEHAGFAPMVRQVQVGEDEVIGRVDHRDPDLPLIAETNSLAFHSTPSDQVADERRYRDLVRAGFTVCVVWENDLWSNPSSVRETIADGRRRARRGEPAVVHSTGCPWPADPLRIIVGVPSRPSRG